jgi:hypothetical protein
MFSFVPAFTSVSSYTIQWGERKRRKKKILCIFSNSLKFISWTTAEASLMAVRLPICPLYSGMEETPNSASVNKKKMYSILVVII